MIASISFGSNPYRKPGIFPSTPCSINDLTTASGRGVSPRYRISMGFPTVVPLSLGSLVFFGSGTWHNAQFWRNNRFPVRCGSFKADPGAEEEAGWDWGAEVLG